MKITLAKFLFFSCIMAACAQEHNQNELNAMGDEELLSLFNEVSHDSIKAEVVARAYLKRGQIQNDTIKMARGYDRLARIFNSRKNRSFADSIIQLTKDIENITYPALGYMLKAHSYYSENNIKNSLQDFTTAFEIAKQRENVNQQIIISDLLIYYKSIWGNKFDALELQKERHSLVLSKYYIEEVKKATREGLNSEYEQLYLEDKILSDQNFILCHLSLKNLDSARLFLKQGRRNLSSLTSSSHNIFKLWFDEANMEILYHEKDYDNVMIISNNLLENNHLKDNNRMNVYFFRGLSFLATNRYLEGIESLKVSDSIFENAKSSIPIKPYKRELFEQLLKHYQRNNDDANSIIYLNKLLHFDSIIKINYRYFEPTFIKNFETPKLIEEKNQIISILQTKNTVFKNINWLILLVLIVSIIFLIYNFYRKLIYQKRFETLLKRYTNETNENPNKTLISSEIIKQILIKLQCFEKECSFLKPEVSLIELAKTFGTNSNYLSRVINLKMEKNFSQYIHHLRIEFAMQELQNNPKFRVYTIKAIAEECGYTNAESFSRAFYKRNGIYPSYFIKKLNQQLK